MTRQSCEPALTLTSGGDTSFPELVWHDGLLWMSYYSSHEGKSAIYLAKVKLPLAAESIGSRDHRDRPLLGGTGHRQAVLERLHVAGLLPAQVLRRVDRDRLPADRPEPFDRLGMGAVDDEGPQPLLE